MQWKLKIGIDINKIVIGAVCIEHFDKNDLLFWKNGEIRLKKGSSPTIIEVNEANEANTSVINVEGVRTNPPTKNIGYDLSGMNFSQLDLNETAASVVNVEENFGELALDGTTTPAKNFSNEVNLFEVVELTDSSVLHNEAILVELNSKKTSPSVGINIGDDEIFSNATTISAISVNDICQLCKRRNVVALEKQNEKSINKSLNECCKAAILEKDSTITSMKSKCIQQEQRTQQYERKIQKMKEKINEFQEKMKKLRDRSYFLEKSKSKMETSVVELKKTQSDGKLEKLLKVNMHFLMTQINSIFSE